MNSPATSLTPWADSLPTLREYSPELPAATRGLHYSGAIMIHSRERWWTAALQAALFFTVPTWIFTDRARRAHRGDSGADVVSRHTRTLRSSDLGGDGPSVWPLFSVPNQRSASWLVAVGLGLLCIAASMNLKWQHRLIVICLGSTSEVTAWSPKTGWGTPSKWRREC